MNAIEATPCMQEAYIRLQEREEQLHGMFDVRATFDLLLVEG